MKTPRLRVSDHAVLRHLERVGGFDIEGLRRQIARRLEAAAAGGAQAVVVEDHVYLIRSDAGTGPTVVSVVPKEPDRAYVRPRDHAGPARRGREA